MSSNLKRKLPSDMPSRPPPQRINILSDVVVSSAVVQPQQLEAAVEGGGGNLGPSHPASSPPVVQISDHDLEAVNPDLMAILDDLEKMAPKHPKLDIPDPQTTSGPVVEQTNLELDEAIRISFTPLPPLLSPLPNDEDVKFISIQKPASSKNKKTQKLKESAPILHRELKNKTSRNNGNTITNFDLSCFPKQADRDVLKEAAQIYKMTKDIIVKEKSAIENIDAEIIKIKERLQYLEDKKKHHLKILDSASNKVKAIKHIFE